MQLREREEKLLLLHVSLSICSAAAPESAIWGVGSRLALRCFSPFIFLSGPVLAGEDVVDLIQLIY